MPLALFLQAPDQLMAFHCWAKPDNTSGDSEVKQVSCERRHAAQSEGSGFWPARQSLHLDMPLEACTTAPGVGCAAQSLVPTNLEMRLEACGAFRACTC